jgi:hypothetical protein
MNKNMEVLKDESWNLVQIPQFAHIFYTDDEDKKGRRSNQFYYSS